VGEAKRLDKNNVDATKIKIKLTSPSQLKELLKSRNIKLKKSLGQHLLCDENVLEIIIANAELTKKDSIIEIGAGIGTLTQRLAEEAGQVIAVEIDPRLIPILAENLKDHSNVEIINRDFLQVDLAEIFSRKADKAKAKVMGNLPYQATSPILEKLIENRNLIESALLMMQKEVAEKLIAPPGSKESTALSIFVQAFAEVNTVSSFSKNVFFPPPKVDSTLIRLNFLKGPRFKADEQTFFRVVRAAFNLRRKTIKKALMQSPFLRLSEDRAIEALEKARINPQRRGETLSIEEFDELAGVIGFDME